MVLFLLLPVVFLVFLPGSSTAPLDIPAINSQADMLQADLHSAGQLLSTLIKRNSQFRSFAQQGLPLILDSQLSREEKKDALLRAYSDFGPAGISEEEKSSQMDTAISTIEAAKQQRLDTYFSRNLEEGNKFVGEIGRLFVEDEYIDGTEEKRRQMLEEIIGKYEKFLSEK